MNDKIMFLMPSYEKGCFYYRSFGELILEMLNSSLSHQRLHPVIKEQQYSTLN